MINPATPTKKVFLNKRFFQYIVRSTNQINKSAELIRLFGGQIEQFLDNEVTYVLTDIPKDEWPPYGRDSLLESARHHKVKLMSLDDLLIWCQNYLNSQFSSDEEEESKSDVRLLQKPCIKFEDLHGHFAPTTKELLQWPELNLNKSIPVGRPLFSVHSATAQSAPTPVKQQHQQPLVPAAAAPVALPSHHHQPITNPPNSTHNNHINSANSNSKLSSRPLFRRGKPFFCEICNVKVAEDIEEHIANTNHQVNASKIDWTQVSLVIESLPSLSTLNMRRLTNLTPPNGVEHQEFLCLHKVDSVSQLFT